MGLRWRLLFFGYPALEILTAWGLASVIGWGWTLFALVAGLPPGIMLMRSAGRSAMSELQGSVAAGVSPAGTGRHGIRFTAGMLLAVPGIWSDLAAILVLTPPSRRWLVKQTPFAQGSGFLWQRQGVFVRQGVFADGDVVQGDVVQGDVLRTRPAGPPGEGGPASTRDRQLPG